MAARRCSLCGISYPTDQKFVKCPVHGEATSWFMNVEPDEDWEWKATALLVRVGKAEAAEIAGITILALEPQPLNRAGLYTLDAHAVIRAGAQLAVDGVFETPTDPATKDAPCDCLWEVVGYHDATRQWIIRPLRVPDNAPNG